MPTCRGKQRRMTQAKAAGEKDTVWSQRCQASSCLLWGNQSFVATKEAKAGGLKSPWYRMICQGKGLSKTIRIPIAPSPLGPVEFLKPSAHSSLNPGEVTFQQQHIRIRFPIGTCPNTFLWTTHTFFVCELLGECWEEHVSRRKLRSHRTIFLAISSGSPEISPSFEEWECGE